MAAKQLATIDTPDDASASAAALGIQSRQSRGGASVLPNHHSTKPTTKQWRNSTLPKDTTAARNADLLLRLVVRRYRVGVLQSHDTTIINNARQNKQIIL